MSDEPYEHLQRSTVRVPSADAPVGGSDYRHEIALVRREAEVLRLQSEVDRLAAELAALKERDRWIPVWERLPDDDAKMLVVTQYSIDTASHVGDGLWDNDNWHGPTSDAVTHWRPLPAGPADSTSANAK